MKIIHTSDWHLGQQFYGYDRSEEHQHFFDQLCEAVQTHQPDALLVCGDVFDTMQPSAAVTRLYVDNLLRLRDACPAMSIIVTSGNHDSPTRLEVDTNLWHRLGVTVVGSVSRDQGGKVNLKSHILTVHSSTGDGSVVGYVAAVPFLRGVDYQLADEELSADDQHPQLHYVDRLLHHTQSVAGKLPVVLVMHTAVRSTHQHNEEERIGNIDYISLSDIMGPRDYLALGHIHRPHTITGSDSRARYCGSPIAMSFDEDFSHSVSLVQLDAHDTPVIEEITITSDQPLLTVPPTPMRLDDAIAVLDKLADDKRGYVRLNVAADSYLPGSAHERIKQRLEGKQLKFCDIIMTSTRTDDNTELHGYTLEEFKQLSPDTVAEQYFSSKSITLDETHRTMLRQAIEQSSQDQTQL